MYNETPPESSMSADEVKIERYMDATGVSFDEARRRLAEAAGDDSSETNPDTTSVAAPRGSRKPSRQRGYYGHSYGEEDNIGMPDEQPLYYDRTIEPLTDEQIRINRAGVEMVRLTWAEEERRKGIYDDSAHARAVRVAREARRQRRSQGYIE
jgi:hypothetical protein